MSSEAQDVSNTPIPSTASSKTSTTPPRITIIGGGVSGIIAAHTLSKLYPNAIKPFITLLEGRSHLGGRLSQTVLPATDGITVDLGPNWIHGTSHNPILELAEKLGETTHEFGEEGDAHVFDPDGQRIEQDLVKEVTDQVWSTIVRATTLSRDAKKGKDTVDEKESLRDFFRQVLDEKYGAEERREKVLVERLARYWGAFVGADYDRQSVKYLWLEECLDGENVFLASTYTKILASIKSLITSDSNIDIKYNTVVNKIDSSAQAVSTTLGETYTYDELIMTMPLGWMKQNHHSTFTPALPSDVIESIDAIGYGNLEKVFVTFPNAWWDKATHTSTNGKKNAFSTFLSDTQSQIVQCISLSSLPAHHSHPTLLFYIFGTHAANLSSQLQSLPQSARPQYLLSQFRPYVSQLPNYDPSTKDCTPLSIYYTNWQADDLAGNGSYSNFQIPTVEGAKALDESIKCLRHGLGEKRLWFAGEHTAPFAGLGTVTGAWWSGEGVAKRIGKKYGVCEMDEDESEGVDDDKEVDDENDDEQPTLKTHDAI